MRLTTKAPKYTSTLLAFAMISAAAVLMAETIAHSSSGALVLSATIRPKIDVKFGSAKTPTNKEEIEIWIRSNIPEGLEMVLSSKSPLAIRFDDESIDLNDEPRYLSRNDFFRKREFFRSRHTLSLDRNRTPAQNQSKGKIPSTLTLAIRAI